MGEVVFSEEVAYLPNSRVALVFDQPTAKVGGKVQSTWKPAAAPSSPSIDDNLAFNTSNIATWGDDNLFPQNIIKLAEKNTELPALLDWKARAAQGALQLPYHRVYDPELKDWKEVPIQDPDIVSFFLHENTKRYYREAYNSFYWFWNVFPDLIKNEAGDLIAYIGTHETPWCRWQKMNSNGIIEKMALSSKWDTGISSMSKNDGKLIDVVDPTKWNLIEEIKANKNLKRFVYPVSYPSPGKAYYQLAPWDGIRTSGWLEVIEKIPVFKLMRMRHQLDIRIICRVPTDYWPLIHKDWDKLTDEQKREKKKQKAEELDKRLAGVENAGKAIIIDVVYDKVTNEKLPGWEIDVLDDKLKDGAYVEDSQEASAHLLRALSLDGTLVGQGPGRNLNAGGGSDKLIAFNMYCALLGPQRQVVDEPVHFVCRYNGWYDRYPFMFIKTIEASPQSLDISRRVSTKVQEQWQDKD